MDCYSIFPHQLFFFPSFILLEHMVFCFPFFFFFFLVMIFLKNYFYRFHFLIVEQLRIYFCNFFLFILSFYEVSMIYNFIKITQFTSNYGFDGVSFFFIVYFFHIQLKKKSHVIKFYKVHAFIHGFGWLTWFVGMTSLTFLLNQFFFISSLDIWLIENLVS